MIDGEVISRAMASWVDPSDMPTAFGTGADGSRAFWQQRWNWTPVDPGQYVSVSGGDSLTQLWVNAAMPLVSDLQRQISTTLQAGTVLLYRGTPVPIGPGHNYPLDATIAEWPPAAQDPWFMQLMLQTEHRSNTVFRLCWHARVPNVIRLSCGLFDRLTGEYRGMVLVDDSNGLGAKTWRTFSRLQTQ